LTTSAALMGVARIHMVILSVLSAGLLLSLSFFESEFNKAKGNRSSSSSNDALSSGRRDGSSNAAKTD
jgi:hypothetical protein